MNLRELAFCVDATNKGDQLYIGVQQDFRDNYIVDLKAISTGCSIDELQKRIDEAVRVKRHRAVGFYSFDMEFDEKPILLRKHRNKYYDMEGKRWNVF